MSSKGNKWFYVKLISALLLFPVSPFLLSVVCIRQVCPYLCWDYVLYVSYAYGSITFVPANGASLKQYLADNS